VVSDQHIYSAPYTDRLRSFILGFDSHNRMAPSFFELDFEKVD
jgi:hypothetical protein